MSDAVFPISAATLQLWFDPGTFQRARAYWQAGKVIKLEYSEDLAQISAQVWGEALSPYRQFISLKPHGAEWRLTDTCSCPIGGRCKHVLAVLLKLKQVYEQQQQGLSQLPMRQLNQWFNDVERLANTDPSIGKLKDVVLYILSYGQSGLQLYPRRVKQSKKGTYTKGQTITQHEFSGYLVPYWIEEADFRLINLFRSQNIREQSLLEDEWGYQLLQQLLATGRCFFGEARHELKHGAPRELELKWLEGKAGHQLMWDLGDDAELEVVYTNPPCYLDTTHFVIGPLTTELSGRELKLLAKMREEYGLAVITEARDATHIDEIIEYTDIIQVGAKAMYDQGILRACAKTDKPVLIKRGFGTTLQEFVQASEFVLSGGNPNVVLCERGIRTFETKTRFTLDLCGVAWLQEYTNLPVILDPSHAMGYAYGVAPLAKACTAMGVDGLLIEAHPNPKVAKSDASQQLNYEEFTALKKELELVAGAVGYKIV